MIPSLQFPSIEEAKHLKSAKKQEWDAAFEANLPTLVKETAEKIYTLVLEKYSAFMQDPLYSLDQSLLSIFTFGAVPLVSDLEIENFSFENKAPFKEFQKYYTQPKQLVVSHRNDCQIKKPNLTIIHDKYQRVCQEVFQKIEKTLRQARIDTTFRFGYEIQHGNHFKFKTLEGVRNQLIFESYTHPEEDVEDRPCITVSLVPFEIPSRT